MPLFPPPPLKPRAFFLLCQNLPLASDRPILFRCLTVVVLEVDVHFGEGLGLDISNLRCLMAGLRRFMLIFMPDRWIRILCPTGGCVCVRSATFRLRSAYVPLHRCFFCVPPVDTKLAAFRLRAHPARAQKETQQILARFLLKCCAHNMRER